MERNANLQMQTSLCSSQENFTASNQINCEEDNTMNCFLCQEEFTDIDKMQDHLSTHYADNWYQDTSTPYYNCNVCGRSLRSELELNEHFRRYHEAPLICKEMEDANISIKCHCGLNYTDPELFSEHIELMHTQKKSKPKESKEHAPKQNKLYVALQYTKPKMKYPPRSPYCNPNLWIDPNGYV